MGEVMRVTALIAAAAMFALPTWGLINGSAYAVIGFGLAGVLVIAGVVSRRTLTGLAIDRPLGVLAVMFALVSWASVSWSFAPDQTIHAALQITLVLLGALVLAAVRLEGGGGEMVILAAAAGLVAGPVVVAVDILLGYPIMTLVHDPRSLIRMEQHYNRGLCHLVLFAWPILFCLWERRYRLWMLGAALAVVTAVLLGSSLSAGFAIIAGLMAWFAARIAPRGTALTLATGISALVLTLPWLIRAVEQGITPWVMRIKSSGVHRLEIWDYMTAHTLERPLLGWGLHTAHRLPVPPEKLATYILANGSGNYPHNQWLQLWVELGVVGVVIGLAFVVVVLLRLPKLPENLRPFAFAAAASTLTLSLMNFEMTTDSWWATIATVVFLFALARQQAEET